MKSSSLLLAKRTMIIMTVLVLTVQMKSCEPEPDIVLNISSSKTLYGWGQLYVRLYIFDEMGNLPGQNLSGNLIDEVSARIPKDRNLKIDPFRISIIGGPVTTNRDVLFVADYRELEYPYTRITRGMVKARVLKGTLQNVDIQMTTEKLVDEDFDDFSLNDDLPYRDCNDSARPYYHIVHPFAPEECDGVDNNCNGQIDEGCVKEVKVWNARNELFLFAIARFGEKRANEYVDNPFTFKSLDKDNVELKLSDH